MNENKKRAPGVNTPEAKKAYMNRESINSIIPQNDTDVKDAFIEMLQSVDVGKHDLKWDELQALRGSGEPMEAIWNAYRYGFLKGQRAEKARAKKDVGARSKESSTNHSPPIKN